jgi:hypothetical protein
MMTDSTTLTDDQRIVVSPRRARHMLDCGTTRLYQLLAAGELESFLDGRSRKITVASIRRYVERRLSTTTATNPPLRRRGRPRKSAAETAVTP